MFPAPEARLVLLSAGGIETDVAMRSLFAQPLDTRAVVQLAEVENATIVLLERLRRLGAGDGEIAHALSRLAMIAEFRQGRIADRLRAAIDDLSAAGVPFMLLKGAAMAVAQYGDVRARPMRDIDVLVRAADARRAYHALRDAGWMPGAKGTESDAFERYEQHHHLPPLVDPAGSGISVELHTALFPPGHPFRFESDVLWDRARPAQLDGRVCLVPHPLDLALHSCLHFAWSNWLRGGAWRAFRDLRTLAADPAFDWAVLVRRARDARAASLCYWVLRLAQRLSGVHVPDDAIAALRPAMPNLLRDAIERHFACDVLPVDVACPSNRLRFAVWSAAVQPNRSGHGDMRPWRIDPTAPSRRRNGSLPWLRRARLREWRKYINAVLYGDARPRVAQS